MKKFKFISTLFLVVSMSLTAFAGGEDEASSKAISQKNILDQLRNNIYSPGFMLQIMGEENLWLKFKLLEDGTVQILETECTNLRLEQTMVKNLNGLRIYTDSSNCNQIYSVKFRFI